MKYFILGGFSSAIFVYGIALVYGASGTTQLAQLSSFLAQNVLRNEGLLAAGTALLLVGLGFKVAAVPFHVWSPDVYEGAPSPITGYMAAVVKVGAFAAALRVLTSGLFTQQDTWRPMVWALAALSMLVGAILAACQRNVKRMLAYSSVSHAGFVLMGVWASSPQGTADALYYLAVYSVLVIGSFAVVSVVSSGGKEDLTDYRGLARRRPALAASLTVLLLAQAGVPFTTGFLAKLAVLEGAVSHLGAAGTTLAVVAMIATAIGVYFYLRLVVLCYSPAPEAPTPATSRQAARLASVGAGMLVEDDRDGASEDHRDELAHVEADGDEPVAPATMVAIALCVLPTIVFGIWAAPLSDLTTKATMLFHP
jgi:NADH-quinone oxidoreductase subunit N